MKLSQTSQFKKDVKQKRGKDTAKLKALLDL